MNRQHAPYDLNKLIHTYDIDNVYEHYRRLEFLHKLENYKKIKESTILELGSASGQMTLMLSKKAKHIVAVDGSSEFLKIAKERTKGVTNVVFQESYLESFTANETFDCLIAYYIFEHIENPFLVFPKLSSLMHKDSVIAIAVPNAHSLSRQLAVKMNLLSSIYELTENDKHHGHYRVYDWKTLEDQVTTSGFRIIGKHGLSFKLFSDRQNLEMIKVGIIGEQQILGLEKLGDEFLEIAGGIMIVATKV